MTSARFPQIKETVSQLLFVVCNEDRKSTAMRVLRWFSLPETDTKIIICRGDGLQEKEGEGGEKRHMYVPNGQYADYAC